jgi:hypothetical protein
MNVKISIFAYIITSLSVLVILIPALYYIFKNNENKSTKIFLYISIYIISMSILYIILLINNVFNNLDCTATLVNNLPTSIAITIPATSTSPSSNNGINSVVDSLQHTFVFTATPTATPGLLIEESTGLGLILIQYKVSTPSSTSSQTPSSISSSISSQTVPTTVGYVVKLNEYNMPYQNLSYTSIPLNTTPPSSISCNTCYGCGAIDLTNTLSPEQIKIIGIYSGNLPTCNVATGRVINTTNYCSCTVNGSPSSTVCPLSNYRVLPNMYLGVTALTIKEGNN